MQLYLITHAHTQVDTTQAAVHWSLSPQGEAQAQMLATMSWWAQVDRIVLSSEAKTRLTVAPLLASRALPVVVDARFDELQRPGWTADYVAQVRQAFAEPSRRAGEWEAAADALARFCAGIAALCQTDSTETIALVGHGLTLSLYRAHLLGRSLVDLAEWRALSFAAVAIVDPTQAQLLQDFQPVAGQLARA